MPSPVSQHLFHWCSVQDQMHLLFVYFARKKAVDRAGVPYVTALLSGESSRSKILRKALVELAQPVSVRSPGDYTK